MKLLQRIDNILGRIEGGFVVLFLTAMVVLTFIRITLRALHVHGHFQWANAVMGYFDWAELMVRLLVLWVAFLGASLVTRKQKHIKIDLMSEFLPSRWLPCRELVLSLVCAVVTALMVKASWHYVLMERSFGSTLFLGMPTWIGQMILPAGFFLIFLRFLFRSAEQAVSLVGSRKR